MEIKHSNPNVARPVERHAGKRRWPWVVLIVLGVLVVMGGIVAALYFYGGTLLKRDSTNTAQTNQPNTPEDQSDGTTVTGLDIKQQPDADDLTNLVIGRFAEDNNMGALKLSTADALDSGELTESKVLTLEPKLEGGFVSATMSPNGQFLAVTENQEPSTGPTVELKHVLSLVELSSGDQTVIDDNFMGLPPTLIWTPDSSHIIYVGTSVDTRVMQSLNSYDVKTGEVTSQIPEFAEDEEFTYQPIMATDNDLFVIKGLIPEGPGELGTLGLDDKGQIGSDFEKIIDLSMASRGLDVSSDGKQIVFARGTGDSLGDADRGPFVLELLDRSTGEIEELRTSATEEYAAPKFTRDSENIIYGAASGVWMLELESGDRTQLVESSEFDEATDVLEPRFVSPNGEFVVIAEGTLFGVAQRFYVLATDKEEQSFNDIGRVEPEGTDTTDSLEAYGWTI